MRRLGPHLAAYVLIVIVMAVVVPLDASFGSDDGAYGGQVHALRQGGWALQRPLPVVAQDNEGWFNTSITPDGPTPYTAKPSYAVALATVVRLVHGEPAPGERAGDLALGLHLLPLAGAVVSALAAWFVARRWDPRAAPLAFWLVGLGPTLINATTLWAHTLGTAFGGLALLGFVHLLPDRLFLPGPGDPPSVPGVPGRRRPAVGTAAIAVAIVASLMAMTAVRSEALYWAVALSGSMVLVSRRPIIVATAAIGTAASTVTWFTDRRWGADLRSERLPIETSIEVLQEGPGWLASRIPAGWQLLVTSVAEGPGPLLAMIALVMAVAGALRLRFHPDEPQQATFLLLASGALYLIRLVVSPGQEISGLFGAWPLLLVLLVASRWSVRRLAPLVIPAVIVLGAVLATQYSSSGGLQWGGRYLSTTFVAIGAGAAIAGERLVRRHPAPLLGLLLVPCAVGLTVTHRLHSLHDEVVAQATVAPSDVVITEVAPLPRIAWTALPTAFYVASADDVDALLGELAQAGVTSVNVHGLRDVDIDGVAGYRVTDETETVRFLARTSPLAFDDGDDG